MLLHRIALAQYSATAADAFNGRGGLLGKGRWHSLGRPIVYAAEHLSLSLAENLVHLQRSNHIAPFNRWEIEVPGPLIASAPSLPAGWTKNYPLTQTLGDAWLASGSSVGLLVPSAIVPEEFNCLLNPVHPQFRLDLIKAGPITFMFDPRLTRP
jgi:RES domain-containing protein